MLDHLSFYFIMRDYNKIYNEYKCRKQYDEFINIYNKYLVK